MSNEFGDYLRALRKAKGLSQRELADRSGVHFTYVSSIERGRMNPPSEAVLRCMAGALEVDAYELLSVASGRVHSPQCLELIDLLTREPLPQRVIVQMLALAQVHVKEEKE